MYVKEGHKKDMYFVCKETIDGGYEIIRVFFKKRNAERYVRDRINGDI